jgi:hypothetical protein
MLILIALGGFYSFRVLDRAIVGPPGQPKTLLVSALDTAAQIRQLPQQRY